MINFLRAVRELVQRIYHLARPFGRKKLATVLLLACAQGVFQVIGVSSIFPFIALAADPDRLRNSNVGQYILGWFPPMDNYQLLLVTGIFSVIMLLVSNGINLLSEMVRIRYTTSYAHWLRQRLLSKIVARPYSVFLNKNSTVFLKKVLGDVAVYTSAILLPLLDTLARVITVILLLITLVYVHPRIAIGAGLSLGILYMMLFFLLAKRRNEASKQIKLAQEGSFKESAQLLSGIKTVKVHCAERPFIVKFSEHSAMTAKIMAIVPIFGSIPRYVIEPFAFGSIVAAIMFYASQGKDLAYILPNLAVMAMAGYRLLPSIQLIYAQMTGLSASRHALDEVYAEIKDIEDDEDIDQEAKGGLFERSERIVWERSIAMKGLCFQYSGAMRPVIEDFNFIVRKNQSLGIIGPTGSGKSTLVDLILGLHMPSKGCIMVDHIVLDSSNRRAWRGGIGYVPQDIFLLDESLIANIAFGVPECEVDHDAVIGAAKAAQIYSFIENELPTGFDTVVGERGVRLSGGQRQRIGLARALYHKPDLLVLDEATSALDVATETEVMKTINAIKGSITVIIIAHRLSTVEQCDEILDLSPHANRQ